MPKYCFAIPAVLDDDCISSAVSLYVKNIILHNDSNDIKFIIHIDDFQYSGYSGTMESISNIYAGLLDYVSCEIYRTDKRKGLKKSYEFLLKKFLESDCDYLIFYDDDHNIINPLPISNDFINRCILNSR